MGDYDIRFYVGLGKLSTWAHSCSHQMWEVAASHFRGVSTIAYLNGDDRDIARKKRLKKDRGR